jgi:hypothetical protein
MTATVSHVSQFHSRIVSSSLFDASSRPSGEKATISTALVCPSSVRSSLPLVASHSLTVVSTFPLASVLPCGSKVTL